MKILGLDFFNLNNLNLNVELKIDKNL